MPDTAVLDPDAAQRRGVPGDGEPGVGQERGHRIVSAAEDRLLEAVAPAEHERVGVRVQIGDDPRRRGDGGRGVAPVVDVHRLEEPAGRRRRQVHQRGIGARHDVRRAAFARDGHLRCGDDGREQRGRQPRPARRASWVSNLMDSHILLSLLSSSDFARATSPGSLRACNRSAMRARRRCRTTAAAAARFPRAPPTRGCRGCRGSRSRPRSSGATCAHPRSPPARN